MTAAPEATGIPTATKTIAETIHRARLPLVSYYAVTVLLPLANGSGSTSPAFLEHVAFVVLAPPALVGIYGLLRHAWQRAARHGRALDIAASKSA